MNPDAKLEPQLAGGLEIIEALRRDGHEAYFAGGCVRDRLLGVPPRDYDIATSARPDTVIASFERTVAVGARFGVIRVLVADGEYEVATFRADLGYSDGRRPDHVEWSSAREDVLRRDFTVNGLLYDPINDTVIDHVGGQEDLAQGVIRAIGDPGTRFEEDKLRLLRAVRFAARLSFRIDTHTWEALVARAQTVRDVSPERIRDELEKMWCEGAPAQALAHLEASGLLTAVLPELADPKTATQRLKPESPMAPAEGWATVLRDLDAPVESIGALARRLRFSNAMGRHVAQAIRIAQAIPTYDSLRVGDRKRLVRDEAFTTGISVAERTARAGQHAPDGGARARADLAHWSPQDLHPERLLNGHALQARGYPPGPVFKNALYALETAQLEGKVTSEEEAWEVVTDCLGPLPNEA